jgi:hypothetical protein
VTYDTPLSLDRPYDTALSLDRPYDTPLSLDRPSWRRALSPPDTQPRGGPQVTYT